MPAKSKYTPEAVATIREALENGHTRKAACAAAGIDQDTLANWQRRYSDFSDVLKKAELAATSEALSVIRTHMYKQWQAAAWWLERRHAEWRIPREIDVSKLTDAQLLALFEAANRAGNQEAESLPSLSPYEP